VKQEKLFKSELLWFKVSKFNQEARKIADRHYSRQSVGDKQFVAPGETIVLLSYDLKALFVWRKAKYRQDNQKGVECTIFRNEGKSLSSDLIKEAEQFAWKRWKNERLFTYIDSDKIKSTNPGHCFIKAGWKKVNGYRSKIHKLILFEKRGRLNEY